MGFLTKIYEMALPNCEAYSPYFYTFCIFNIPIYRELCF